MSKEIKELDMFDEKELNEEPMRDISTRQPKISLRSGAKGANDTQYFTGIDVVDAMTIDTLTVSEDGIYTPPSGVMGYNRVEVNVTKQQPVTSGATIYDYDGTIIATYTPEQFAALESYPAHPEHEYLTPNGYNVALATAQAYAAKYGYVEVGAQYYTVDRKTRLFITLDNLRHEIRLGLGVDGSVDIDWGDNSEHGTITGSSSSTPAYSSHDYVQGGDYVITLTVTGTATIIGAQNSIYFLTKPDNTDTTYNEIYIGSLTKVLIGNNTLIGPFAFNYCRSLKSIMIPDSITWIGYYAFSRCYRLKSLIIPHNVTTLGDNMCSESCESLSSIVIPYTVSTISTLAFANCHALQKMVIPDSITTLKQQCFNNCHNLSFVVISDSITNLEGFAFDSCFQIRSANFPPNVVSIGQQPFARTMVTSFDIPVTCTTIDYPIFSSTFSLSSIKFLSSTPPYITTSTFKNSLTPDCIIYVPEGSLSAYTSATNYPDPNTYTYVEY